MLFLMLLLAVSSLSASAEDQYTYYDPINKIDLGVNTLELNVGESYTFQLKHEPVETPTVFLTWNADRSVLTIDEKTFTITATAPGKTRVLVEGNAGFAWDHCDVVVRGDATQDNSHKQSGSQMINLSSADRKKIKAATVNNYIAFLESNSYTDKAFKKATDRRFYVTAKVKPGQTVAESKRAQALGMEKALDLPDLDAVSLCATLEQLLAYIRNNSNLIEIFEFAPVSDPDPITEEFDIESVQKAMNLQGSVEALTSVSTAHKLGLKGGGTVIAIVDSGISKNHEQFKGRVIAEDCEAPTNYEGYKAVCTKGSSAPSLAKKPELHNHGSHVAGIAAGKDGIAPEAKIISISARTENCSGSQCVYSNFYDPYIFSQYLVNLQKSYKKAGKPLIAAVNMSWGGNYYDSYCDDTESYTFDAFKLLTDNGIIPVTAAGNSGYNGYYDSAGVSFPACLSNSVTVSWLADQSSPLLYPYSNHSKLVDIAAPGTNIRSAFYAYEEGSSVNTCTKGINCYGIYMGTSMAAPTVTGAFAILKQAVPDKTVAQYKKLLTEMSTKSVSKMYYYNAGVQKKPVLDFSKIGNYTLGKISITDTHQIRGYTNGITVKFKNVTGASGFLVTVKDKETGKTVKPTVTVKKDSTGQYTIIDLNGTMLKNGHPYRISMTPYKKSGGSTIKGTTRTVNGAPNPRMTAITAVPGDKNVSVRVVPSKYADGFHYSVYQVNPKTKIKTIDVPKGANVVKKFTGLKNGTLYYVEAIPYAKIDGNKYYGASVYVIYFAPLSKPAGAKVSFSNNTTAKISMSADSSATGIKVMYRTPGGSMQNGCESSGASCSVNNLKKSGAYEFYVMKYKTINGKNHYGPGVTLTYKTTASGLPAPTNPLIAKRGSKLLTFTIDKASNAKGISVLYREGEGAFKQACEKAAATCEKDGFDWSKKYTFYIMQYKAVNGKKVYSPGVTVTNWLTPKTVGSEEEILAGLSYTESKAPDEIYEVLEDYMTEEDLEMYEAFDAMGVDESDYIEEIDELDGILEGDLELYDEAQPLDEYDDEEADTTGATEVNDPNPVETDPQSGETEYAEPTEKPQPGESDDPEPTPVPAEPEFQTMEFYWLSGADRYPYDKGVPSFNRK